MISTDEQKKMEKNGLKAHKGSLDSRNLWQKWVSFKRGANDGASVKEMIMPTIITEVIITENRSLRQMSVYLLLVAMQFFMYCSPTLQQHIHTHTHNTL